MAEETIMNGIDGGDAGENENTASSKQHEKIDDDGSDAIVSDLNHKLEIVEKEKIGLMRENQERIEKIKWLTDEIEGLKMNQIKMNQKFEEMQNQIHQSEQDKKSLEAIAARAVELETEVSRLQHDLISAMSESEETKADFKKEVEELKRRNEEKERKIEEIDKEKAAMVEEGKKLKVESEKRVKDLEEKLNEVEASKGKMGLEKESEILGLNKEKKEIESLRSSLEKDLKESTKNLEGMEKKVNQLQMELEEARKINLELNEKKLVMNGTEMSEDKGLKCLKKENKWAAPVALAGTGTVAVAMAAVYYSRRR